MTGVPGVSVPECILEDCPDRQAQGEEGESPEAAGGLVQASGVHLPGREVRNRFWEIVFLHQGLGEVDPVGHDSPGGVGGQAVQSQAVDHTPPTGGGGGEQGTLGGTVEVLPEEWSPADKVRDVCCNIPGQEGGAEAVGDHLGKQGWEGRSAM